jgi:dUTP pyrophosphatase
MRIAIQMLSPLVSPPEYATAGAAGMDLQAAVADPVALEPGEFKLVPCGFAVAIPEGFEAQVRPRSGLAARYGVTVLNAPGTIDCDYRGEVKVLLINHGSTLLMITPGMRIAQLVIASTLRVEWDPRDTLTETARADGGFGHTGH